MKMTLLNSLGIMGLSLSSASAASISVNFHAADVSSIADHELSAGEVAGLTPIGGWNNINVGAPAAHNTATTIFASTSLIDDAGVANAATISQSAPSSWFVGYAASAAGTAAELGLANTNQDDLYNSYLALNSPNGDGSPADEATIDITGLTSAYTANGYQLIIYSDSDRGPANAGDRTSVFTVTPGGGTAITALTEDDGSVGAAAATFDGTFIASDNLDTTDAYSNYTIISGLTAADFTIAVTSPDGGRGSINGFQIIANPVPEPSTSLLLGLIGTLSFLRRSR